MFYLHLIYEVLHQTKYCQSILKKNQDILEVTSLVRETMNVLKSLRNMRFDKTPSKVFSFCQKHNMNIVDVIGNHVTPKSRRTKINIISF